jgi:hypothetical protein
MIQFDNAVEKFNEIVLKELYENDIKCWIAGGSLRDYFMGIPLNTDFDIFFPDQTQYEKAKKYFEDKKADVKWESENGMKVVYEKHTFDLIKIFFPSPMDTINNFDFTVSMFAVDKEKVYHGETSFIDLSKRQLMFNKILYPASSLSRSFRYLTKGFKICKGETKKLCEAIQNMPKEEKKEETNQNIDDQLRSSLFFLGID